MFTGTGFRFPRYAMAVALKLVLILASISLPETPEAAIAGYSTPGSTAYPSFLRRLDHLSFGWMENASCMAMDSEAGFAYVGLNTSPGQIVRIALGTGASQPFRNDLLTLDAGENNVKSATIDTVNGYLYVGTNTIPGRIVKIALRDFTRVGAVTLNAGENGVLSGVVDPSSGYGCFGTDTSPGIVVKVLLGIDDNAPSRHGAVTLNAGENILRSAVLNTSGYIFFGTGTSPGRVVKVAFGSGSNLPSRAGALSLSAGQNDLLSAGVDSSAGYGYFGTSTTPGQVIKVSLGTGTNPPSLDSAVTFQPGEDGAASIALNPATGYAMVGTASGLAVKIRLGNGVLPFERVESASAEFNMFAGAMDETTGYAYFAGYDPAGSVIKIDPGPGDEFPTVIDRHFGFGANAQCIAIDSQNSYAYVCTTNFPGDVIKIRLGESTTPAVPLATLGLSAGEDLPRCILIDPANGCAYIGTGTSPGRIVKISLGTGDNPPTRLGAITLEPGENNVRSVTVDDGFQYAYFGTDSGHVVKVQLTPGSNPPIRIGAVATTRSNLWSAAFSSSNNAAYFASNSSGGEILKVSPGAGAALPSLDLGVSHGNLPVSLSFDATGNRLFAGLDTNPGTVHMLDPFDLSSDDAVTLNSGEFGGKAVFHDAVSGNLFVGTALNPGTVIKYDLPGSTIGTRQDAEALRPGEGFIRSVAQDARTREMYYVTVSSGTLVRMSDGPSGVLRATRFLMPQLGVLDHMNFYSHASSGNLRLAIYDDNSPRQLVWESNPVANNASNAILQIPTSSGTPSELALNAGTYWLAWQSDAGVPTGSYSTGLANNGFRLLMPFEAYPSEIRSSEISLTDERWTQYIDYTVDTVSPSVLLSIPPSRVNGPFQVTATFSESVSGLTAGEISVTNGAVSLFSGSGSLYNFTVTPVAEGSVTIGVPEDVAQDIVGNLNNASSIVGTLYDTTSPTVTLTYTDDPVTSVPVNIPVNFSETVTSFTLADINVTNGTATDLSGSAAAYEFVVTPVADGAVSVTIPANVAQDLGGNLNTASNTINLTSDKTSPTVALSYTGDAVTSVSAFITVLFGETVIGFNVDDINVSNGSASGISGAGANYSFFVTPAADGPVSVSIPAARAIDFAGNANTASNVINLTYDTTPPGVTLSSTVGAVTLVPFQVNVAVTENVSAFSSSDVTVVNGNVSDFSGTANAYGFTVNPDLPGAVEVRVDAGAFTDVVGLPNTQSNSISTQQVSVPADPALLTADPAGTNAIDLAWSDNSDNETGFLVERRLGSGSDFDTVTTVSVDGEGYLDRGLEPGTEYCYRVSAINDFGQSGFTAVVCAFTATADTHPDLIGRLNNPGDAGDRFGFAVSRLGKLRLAVGAPGAQVGAHSAAGKVYVFTPPALSPTLTISNPNPASNAQFGYSLGFAGENIVVGAPGTTETVAGGAAYLLEGTTGAVRFTFQNPYPAQGTRFGASVSGIGTKQALIGTPGDEITTAGYAHVFDAAKTGLLVRSFTAPVPLPGDRFGMSVAAAKSEIAAVSHNSLADPCTSGVLHVFNVKKGTLTASIQDALAVAEANGSFLLGSPHIHVCPPFGSGQAHMIKKGAISLTYSSPNLGTRDAFGAGLGGGKTYEVIGSPHFDRLGADDSGSAFVFGARAAVLLKEYTHPSPGTDDNYGAAVSQAGKTFVAIGAPGDDSDGSDAGSVYLYNISKP